MRRFEALVMSPTEPVTDGTLWLKGRKSTIKDQKPNELPPIGMSIWYFSEEGWKPLIDFDTRYNLNDLYDYAATSEPINTVVTPHHEVGIVDVDRTYSFYDASRELGDNANIVNEAGLKHHVDFLQGQVDSLSARVTALEEQLATLQGRVNQNTNSISTLNSRVSALES